MKIIITLVITVIICIGYGCNNSVKKDDENIAIVQTNNATETIEQDHSSNDSIELNNGAKWEVVPEMMKHIRNMESDVNRFNETQHSEVKDFTLLGKKLQKNIDLLTSNCTMQGKAHDELHKWLLPYIGMVDKLNKSKTKNEAFSGVEAIAASFKTLNIYFK